MKNQSDTINCFSLIFLTKIPLYCKWIVDKIVTRKDSHPSTEKRWGDPDDLNGEEIFIVVFFFFFWINTHHAWHRFMRIFIIYLFSCWQQFANNLIRHLDSDSEVFRWFRERVRRKTRPLPVEFQLHVDVAFGLAGLVRIRETCRWFQLQRRQLAAPVLLSPCHPGRSGFLQQAQRLHGFPRARLFCQPVAGTRPRRPVWRCSPRIRMYPGFGQLHHGTQDPRHATVHPNVGRCSLIPVNLV